MAAVRSLAIPLFVAALASLVLSVVLIVYGQQRTDGPNVESYERPIRDEASTTTAVNPAANKSFVANKYDDPEKKLDDGGAGDSDLLQQRRRADQRRRDRPMTKEEAAREASRVVSRENEVRSPFVNHGLIMLVPAVLLGVAGILLCLVRDHDGGRGSRRRDDDYYAVERPTPARIYVTPHSHGDVGSSRKRQTVSPPASVRSVFSTARSNFADRQLPPQRRRLHYGREVDPRRDRRSSSCASSSSAVRVVRPASGYGSGRREESFRVATTSSVPSSARSRSAAGERRHGRIRSASSADGSCTCDRDHYWRAGYEEDRGRRRRHREYEYDYDDRERDDYYRYGGRRMVRGHQ